MPTQLADAVLLLHLAVTLFVVIGLPAVVVGNLLGWRAVNAPAFRWTHLALIAVVVVQSWLGLECPLTTLENWLRRQDGARGYDTSFIEHWASAILFYRAPTWVFVLVYSVFAGGVVATWLKWPPRKPPVPGYRRTTSGRD